MPGPFHWAGPTDQYFAAVFIPDDPAAASMVTLNHSMPIPKDPKTAAGDNQRRRHRRGSRQPARPYF